MSRSSPFILLKEMRDRARVTTSFVDGLEEPAFIGDERTRSAVAMQLIVIGEIATKLARKHPELSTTWNLPLRDMTDMRNRIAHGYLDLNWQTVWQLATVDLHHLIERLNELIDNGETHGQS